MLETGGGGGGGVDDRLQLAGAVAAKRHFLDRRRTMRMAEHLLARHDNAHRALQVLGGQRGQIDVVLRTQAGTEGTADIFVLHAHIGLVEAEHARQIGLDVLCALGFVVDGDLAVAFPMHGGRVHLHRIVVMRPQLVGGAMGDGRGEHGGVGVAARLGRNEAGAFFLRHEFVAHRHVQVGVVRRGFVFDRHQAGGVARGFQSFGHHQRHRLRAEGDLVVVQGAEWRAGWRHLVRVVHVEERQFRAVVVGDDVDHAGDVAGGRFVDGDDAALGDGAGDDPAIQHIGRKMFGRVARGAGDLVDAVDAADRLSNSWDGTHGIP